MPFRLERLQFNDGQHVDIRPLTVLVGPNNSGKSRALRDVEQLLITQREQLHPVVVVGVDRTFPESFEVLSREYDIRPDPIPNGNFFLGFLGSSLTGMTGSHYQPNTMDIIVDLFASPLDPNHENQFKMFFGQGLVVRLGTEERLTITKVGPSIDSNSPPMSVLQWLYINRISAEPTINHALLKAFGTMIKLDFSRLHNLCLRVGQGINTVSADPLLALKEFAQFELLDEQGDGIRSYVAVLIALVVLRRAVTLIDEPEAFLHQSQAFSLGALIASSTNSLHQVVLATHSTDLLRGILSVRSDISIIRLTRIGAHNPPSILSQADLGEINADPLLSSARVLDGIFYAAVVVTEADADRSFYERIASKFRPDDNIHYVHAQNKQTLGRVLRPYRKLGVPAAAIVDADIVRVEIDLKRLLEAAGASPELSSGVIGLRTELSRAINTKSAPDRLQIILKTLSETVEGADTCTDEREAEALITKIKRTHGKVVNEADAWIDFKTRGISALNVDAAKLFKRLCDECTKCGIFIVPCGELESWSTYIGVSRVNDKGEWITRALSVVGILEPRPDNGPWAFIRTIHDYLAKGTLGAV